MNNTNDAEITVGARGRVKINRYNRGLVYAKTEGHCAYCGKYLHPFSNWYIEHLIPFNPSKADTLDNLWPSCPSCNVQKKNRSLAGFRNQVKASFLLRVTRMENIIEELLESSYLISCGEYLKEMLRMNQGLAVLIENTEIKFYLDALEEDYE